MITNPKLSRLSLMLLAVLMTAAAWLSTPAPTGGACLAICDGGWCCCGKVSARDYCTGKHVCVSACLSP
jgi:hypothetical protein